MLKRALVKNFQSIKSLEIDLNHPVIVITGPTDEGKSAILRAIKNLIFDGVGGGFYRKEVDPKTGKTKTCATMSVEVESDRGKVAWLKSKTDATYVINDTDRRENCGRVVPGEVATTLGLTSENSLGENLHYRSQFDPAFLLNDRGGKECYRFISRLMGADVVIESVAALEKNSRELAKDVKVSGKVLKEAEDHLNSYFSGSDIAEMETELAVVNALKVELVSLGTFITILEGIQEKNTEYLSSLSSYEKASVVFRVIDSLATQITGLNSELSSLEDRLLVLSELKTLPSVLSHIEGRLVKASWIDDFDCDLLLGELKKIEQINSFEDILESVLLKKKELMSIEIDDVTPIDDIVALNDQLQPLSVRLELLTSISGRMAELRVIESGLKDKENEIIELEKDLPLKLDEGSITIQHQGEAVQVALVGSLFVSDPKSFEFKGGSCG